MARLAPAVSMLSRQMMRAAFEDLERTITPVDSHILRSTSTLQQVRTAAVEIENQLAAKGSLRNMRRLVPLFRGLEHYAKVVDVLCNGTPYLSWIWAPITLVLRIASEYVEAFEQLMKGYTRIADCLTRFELLSDTFITNPDFQQTLAVFYADILQFHKHAYKFIRQSGWRLLFLTSWGRFQRRFENILDDLKRHGELIDLEANAHNIAEARQMRQDIRIWREESLDQVRRDDEECAAKHYRSIMSWLRFDESEQLSVFGSILEEGSKFPGTCAWIVQHPIVCAWLQRRPNTPFVWLHGHPGTGKSVISGQLVNFIQAQMSFVISHFSTYSYVLSTKYEYIVKSFLLQLIRTSSESLAYVYQECVLGKKSPSITILEQLLHLITLNLADEPGEIRYLWVVLDGLDQCEADKQPRLLSLLKNITTKSTSEGTVCKVLVSSRYSATLFKHLRKQQTISLSDESDQLNKAIRNYTIQRLQSSAERLHQLELEPEDFGDIASAIAQKADSMFLYARLVLDYLTTNIFYSCDELKGSIHQLPQTLSDFYNKILTEILTHLDSRSVNRIKVILGWIAFAQRPLKRFELLSAVSFSLGNPNVERPAPPYILDICSPLVGERQDTTLVFIHISVKEFLQSSSLGINERQALSDHGIATITCLLSGLQVFNGAFNKQANLIRLIRGVYGLHVYATEFWTEYLLSEAEATGRPDILSPFLAMAFQLANRLDEVAATTASMECIGAADDDDERLLLFQGHEVLYKHIRAALRSRSRKRLEMELLSGAGGSSRISRALLPIDGISCMLQSYQNAIEALLNEDFHPGVSAEEPEMFKTQFRTSAYTCHLRSCPRATIGFETDLLRCEHEMAHVGGFRCTYSDCQYPPFPSSRALKAHVSSCHNIVPERKPIRRVGALSAPYSSASWKPHPKQQISLSQYSQSQALQIQDQLQKVDTASDSWNLDQTGSEKSGTYLKVGAEVAFRNNKYKGLEGEFIQCTILSVSGEGVKKRYEIQDPEPDDNGNPGQVYKASAAYLFHIPPPSVLLPKIPKGKQVLARYPDTTTFYKAEVKGMKITAAGHICRLHFDGEEEENREVEVERRYVLDVSSKGW